VTLEADPVVAPRRKAAMPPLEARAPRPAVVRLRGGLVAAAAMGAAGLLATSLAWAFVVEPELRDDRREGAPEPPSVGAVRPTERLTGQPASYGELDRLPPPRRLGGTEASPPDAATRPELQPASAPRRSPRRSTALDRAGAVAEAQGSDLFFAGRGGAPPSAPTLSRDYAAVYNPHQLIAPLSPYEVKAGALIPALLLTGVDTARAGPVSATVAENVYDTVSGRHLLIPQGARLLGRHEGESRHGDRRAFVTWERLMLPNGKSLILPREPGVDAQGRTGVAGAVDRRLLPLVTATLFAGAVTALGQAARDEDDGSGGWLGDAGDGAAITAAQVGGKLIDRELQVRPSIRLKPGARVRVLVTRDLMLEPYRR
jgi:type IV secretion system protein VirB10